MIGVVYARFVQPPAIIHLLNKVYKSSMVDQLLLVFCDNVCIQIFSAVFCITLNVTADTFKLASTLWTKETTPRDGRRGRGERGMEER